MENSLFKYFNVNNLIDWAIIGGLLFSILFGLYRGFIREFLGLILWVGAFSLALYFATPLADQFPDFSTPLVRQIICFVGIFIVALLFGTVIRSFIEHSQLVRYFSGVDRLLGFTFGLLRGFLVFAISITLLTPTSAAQQESWKTSKLIPIVESVQASVLEYLPQSWQDWIQSKMTPVKPIQK